jgi:predicted MPP superfamily phosphohydrolase
VGRSSGVSRFIGRRARPWLAGSAAVVSAGAGALAYARWAEPRWLMLRTWELALPQLPSAWDGFRIAQLSDFHVGGPGMSLPTLREAVRRTAALRPDLIVLTGDFMDRGRWRLEGEGLFEPLARAAPTYAVLGNHDFLSGDDNAAVVAEGLRRQGVTVLRNESALAGPAASRQVIVGVDDWASGHADMLRSVEGKPEGMAPFLLLCHEPDIVDTLPRGWFQLVLAGHTHGAQIRLSPFRRLSWLEFGISEIHSRYPRGFFRVNDTVLYVNQGLGMSELPLRFGARPEVTLLGLRSRPSDAPAWTADG